MKTFVPSVAGRGVSFRRSRVALWVAVAVGLALLIALANRGTSPQAIAARKGRLVVADVPPLGSDSVSTRWDVKLRSSTGLQVHALLRTPREMPPHAPAVVLMVNGSEDSLIPRRSVEALYAAARMPLGS